MQEWTFRLKLFLSARLLLHKTGNVRNAWHLLQPQLYPLLFNRGREALSFREKFSCRRMQKHLTRGINFKKAREFHSLWILRLECWLAAHSDAFIANLMKCWNLKARKLSARLVAEAPTASCQRINRICAIYALQRISDGAVFTQRYEIKRGWEGRSEDVRGILRRLMDVWTVQTNDFKVVYSTGRG